MKRTIMIALALGLLTCLSANASEKSSAERQSQPAASDDKTAPSYDMKAQALVDLQQMQKKYTDLAQAIPADKYTWRPEPGTRSVSELFLHVAGANYGIPTMISGTAPDTSIVSAVFEISNGMSTSVVCPTSTDVARTVLAKPGTSTVTS